ncbi:hypothetical protein LTV02_23190 [Nocardia yamanashiensis]|uniref:hypothetical protein n=1 Tax=Nocardia yamanashiensis TaxID=209247 RepID=UPI001E3F8FD7|nr:hypothetical protein [Nocardia yamanashiensis]UGT39001.1 hypothetical protein LTV02_23190 [Nocardia yamanashiensis]
MTDEQDRSSDASETASDAPRPAARRAGSRRLTPAERAKLARIFGDPLPDTTSDERTPERDSRSSSDEWLRNQVPPHHG